MTATAMTDAQHTSAPYEVGYGKPPRRTQFRKGQSGNPGGRPRQPPMERANALLLEEAYRCVAIEENGHMVPVTALQAVLRSQVELAMNGHFRGQRYLFEKVRSLEILKATGVYGETDEGGESDEEDESGEADETGEGGEEDETDEGDETRRDHIGMVVTAAPDRAPTPERGAAPPVFSTAPLARPAAPSRRRRTPALAHSRGGRRHAVTEKPAMGGAQAAPKPGRIRRENSRSAESRKIPC